MTIYNTIFPFSVMECPWLAPAALAADLAFGDPHLPWPHPVCLIGKALDFLEKPARAFAKWPCSKKGKFRAEKIAGFLCVALCCLAVGAVTNALCHFPLAEKFLALYLAWAGLAMGCLLSTGAVALDRIEHASILEGREAVSWLVTRDTGGMERERLRKTLADTMSENFTDAFTAPFFWLLLTGPVGLWLYKTVSTFDSRWGYLCAQWAGLGYAGAKADDFLAWIPARLSPWILWTGFSIPSKNQFRGKWPGWPIIARQAKTMTSPNSGWSMTACAWLCNGRMAGPDIYFGEIVQKGWLGPQDASPWNETRLLALFSLLKRSTLAGGISLWLLGMFLTFTGSRLLAI